MAMPRVLVFQVFLYLYMLSTSCCFEIVVSGQFSILRAYLLIEAMISHNTSQQTNVDRPWGQSTLEPDY